MDFQENKQPENQHGQQNIPPNNNSATNSPLPTPNQAPVQMPNQQSVPAQNQNRGPALGAQPSGNSPYNNSNNGMSNNQLYGNPYNQNPNGSNGYNNNHNGYNNGYNNTNPYYNRNIYRMPQVEPGNSLFTAAFILGIIAIVFCFTFTVYPAYIFGSIAIILALLSKGKNAKMHSKANVGVICAIAALVLNTCIVTYSMTTIFTDPEVYEEFNETCEEMYGMSFDEMIEEIMEENGTTY